MATLRIKEYEKTPIGSNGESTNFLDEVQTVYQTPVAFTTSTQSAAFTYPWVVVQPDTDCYIAFGANPTADNTKHLKILANERVGFKVVAGPGVTAPWKLAVST